MTRRWKDAAHDKWVGAHPSDTDADRGHFTGYVAVTIYTKETARSITLTRANARQFACYLLDQAAPKSAGRHPDFWISVEAHGDCQHGGTWGVMLHHQPVGAGKSATLSLNEWRSDCLQRAKSEARAYAKRLGIEYRPAK